MKKQEYSVTVWRVDKNSRSADQRWRGVDKSMALIIAAYEFIKEVILIEAEKKGIVIEPWHKVDMAYAPKVRCLITVLEEIDPALEADGQRPEIIQCYGNDKIEIFQRIHRD